MRLFLPHKELIVAFSFLCPFLAYAVPGWTVLLDREGASWFPQHLYAVFAYHTGCLQLLCAQEGNEERQKQIHLSLGHLCYTALLLERCKEPINHDALVGLARLLGRLEVISDRLACEGEEAAANMLVALVTRLGYQINELSLQ